MKKLEQLVANGVNAFNEGNLEIALVINDMAIRRGNQKKVAAHVKELLHSNKGFTLLAMERFEDALAQFDLANRYKHTDENGWSIFLCLANLGRWDKAKRYHHHRYGKTRNAPTRVTFPDMPIPLAKSPSDFIHKKVLIINEQGMGDELLFFSGIQKLAWSCESITLQCYPEMRRLFEPNLPKNVTLFTEREMSYEMIMKHDICSNTGDFFIFSQSLSNVFHRFLEVPKKDDRSIASRIGYCWKANNISPNAKMRSVEPDVLADFPNKFIKSPAECISLQKDDKEDCPEWMTPFPDDITDFYDTAQLMIGLEHVVTVDTSIAHLAGSLGIATTLIINKHHDWRWRAVNSDGFSLFYPTIKVVRLQDELKKLS